MMDIILGCGVLFLTIIVAGLLSEIGDGDMSLGVLAVSFLLVCFTIEGIKYLYVSGLLVPIIIGFFVVIYIMDVIINKIKSNRAKKLNAVSNDSLVNNEDKVYWIKNGGRNTMDEASKAELYKVIERLMNDPKVSKKDKLEYKEFLLKTAEEHFIF